MPDVPLNITTQVLQHDLLVTFTAADWLVQVANTITQGKPCQAPTHIQFWPILAFMIGRDSSHREIEQLVLRLPAGTHVYKLFCDTLRAWQAYYLTPALYNWHADYHERIVNLVTEIYLNE